MHITITPHTVWRGKAPMDFEKIVGDQMIFGVEEDEGMNKTFTVRRADLVRANVAFMEHEIYIALTRFFNAYPAVNIVELQS